LSQRPENLMPVHPARPAVAASAEPSDEASAPSGDLMDMDPVDFEDLVAALFQAMGMQVMTTARSGDGGVDVKAMDPDPIRGGKLVIQVKRYQHTIPPSQSATCTARRSTKAPPRRSSSRPPSSGPAHKNSPPENPSPSSAAGNSPTC
jgi:hypothetical protein